MPLRELWNDVKAHLEHGRALQESHVPAIEQFLAEHEAEQADPLVAAARGLQVPDGLKVTLASLLHAVEADVKQAEQDAARQAVEAVSSAQDPAGAPAEAGETSGEAAAS